MQLTHEGSPTPTTECANALLMISHQAAFVKATFGQNHIPSK